MPGEKNYSHLDFEKRCLIEKYLNQSMGLSFIAKETHLSLSTVSREVKRNRRDDGYTKHKKTTHICKYRRNCSVRALCKEKYCRRRKCSTCDVVLCTNLCEHYEPEICMRTERAPYCCNGCVSVWGCALHRYRYDAKCAQKMAESRLKDSRGGIMCTEDEFNQIIDLVRPLLKQGIGLDSIWCEHKERLGISKRTFYRWADLGYGVINMELPKKVSYRPRKKSKADKTPRPDLEGRRYEDFLKLPEDVRLSAFEMDCVEGLKRDKQVILTLLHKRTHFQCGVLLKEHTCECVVRALDALELTLGKDFKKLMGILVVDRGHEFSAIEAMEKSVLGRGRRLKVYVCDPQRPDQRGQSERAHVFLRKVLPKKVTSFDSLTPWDIASVFSHVNSLARPSLGGASPLALAMAIFPKNFFEELGLVLVPTTMICLRPSLLNRKENSAY